MTQALEGATAYARVDVRGDLELAQQEAMRKVTEVVHLVNFSLSSTMQRLSWSRIRLSSAVFCLVVSSEKKGQERPLARIKLPLRSANALSRKEVTSTIGRLFTQIPGYAEVAPYGRNWHWPTIDGKLGVLLATYVRSGEMAARIQRAITWYGKAVDAETLEEQFVGLAIALESLLVGDEGKGPFSTTGSISQNLGERVAFLLAAEYKDRKAMLSETKRLYGLRSAIVHRGQTVSSADLIKMDGLVKQATLAFIVHDFKSWSEFQKWVEEQKLSRKLAPREEIREPTGEETREDT